MALFTDGIANVLTDSEACSVITNCNDAQEASKFITDQSLQYGSEDNATAIVLPFGSWGKEKDAAMFYSFGKTIGISSRFGWGMDLLDVCTNYYVLGFLTRNKICLFGLFWKIT